VFGKIFRRLKPGFFEELKDLLLTFAEETV